MRIISQDGTRDFPYESTALILRHRKLGNEDVFVIVALYCGKEHDLAYYHNSEFAYGVLEEIRSTPEYIDVCNKNNDDQDDEAFPYPVREKILSIVLPKDQEVNNGKEG